MKYLLSIFITCCAIGHVAAEGVSAAMAKSPDVYLPGGAEYMPDAPLGQTLCHDPRFHCHAVERGETWGWLFPDTLIRNEVMRLNRTNVGIQYRPYIIVPNDKKHIDFMSWSPLPKAYPTHHHRLLLIDLDRFAYGAYDTDGHLEHWGPVTAGRATCPDSDESCRTVTGTFHIQRMGGPKCYSHTYPLATHGGAPMPYCMFFYKGYSIHGSTLSGFVNRSRGCVHVFDADAKWLNQDFLKIGTKVIVKQKDQH